MLMQLTSMLTSWLELSTERDIINVGWEGRFKNSDDD